MASETEVDLILCGAIIVKEQEYFINKIIDNLSKIKFKNKYILFDGPPVNRSKERINDYQEFKNRMITNHPDFIIIENEDNIYYKPLLNKFLLNNNLSENLFIIQDDVLTESLDLEKLLTIKESKKDCKILYIGEKRKRASHWFTVINTEKDLTQTHGWCERAYLVKTEDLKEIFKKLSSVKRGGYGGRFIDVYYQNVMNRVSWKRDLTDEQKLEYWKFWGCYCIEGMYHRHLVAKR